MENFCKRPITQSASARKSLASVTPSISNLKRLNITKNSVRNDLKQSCFKTPNKTPLHLKHVTSGKKNTPRGALLNDRYIPNRMGSNMEVSYHLLRQPNQKENQKNSNDTNIINGNRNDANNSNNLVDSIKRKLIIDTCNGIKEKSKVLQIHNKPADSDIVENMKSLYTATKKEARAYDRVIPSVPERILDAPDFRDDYYLNLMDWSSNNHLAVALEREVFLWNASGGGITQVMSMDDNDEQPSSDYITSTAWITDKSSILAIGNSCDDVEIWDVNRNTRLRCMQSHDSRVGSLSWNQHILTSGSRDGDIHHHDVRVRDHHVATLRLHSQEVCGLKWSPDGRYLASGGNDNLVAVWDSNMQKTETTLHENPLHVFREHAAAVKAVSWCPWQSNLLATGGGTADGKIKIWNIYNGSIIHSKDVNTQISCLLWSKEHKEIISSHGFQMNQLSIWRYPDMAKVCDLTGHTNRVLAMAMSPDNEMVCSAGADETLRLWRCFGLSDKQKQARENIKLAEKKSASCSSLSRCIR